MQAEFKRLMSKNVAAVPYKSMVGIIDVIVFTNPVRLVFILNEAIFLQHYVLMQQ